jgi:hypothetical protein
MRIQLLEANKGNEMNPPRLPPFLSVISLALLGAWAWFRWHGVDITGFLGTGALPPGSLDWTWPSLASTYASHLLHILFAIFILLLCLIPGQAVMESAAGRNKQPVIGTATGIIAGFGLLSLAYLALGLSGLFYPPLLLVIPLAVAALFRGRVAPSLRALAGLCKVLHPSAFLVLLPAFIIMLAPETDGDSVRFHLPLGQAFLAAHRATALPDNIVSWYTHAHELVAALGLAWGLDSTGRVLNVAWLLLTGMLVQGLAKNESGPARSVWIMPLLVTVSWIPSLGASSKNDLFCLLALTASISTAFSADYRPKPRYLLLGLAAGIIYSVKMVYLPYSFALILFLALQNGGPAGIRRMVLPAGAGFLLVALPWMASSWLAVGNPVFPLFAGFFVSPFFTEECRQAFPHGWQSGWISILGLTPALSLLLFPVLDRQKPAMPGLGRVVFPALLLGWLAAPKYSARYALPLAIPIILLVAPWADTALRGAGKNRVARLLFLLALLAGSWETVQKLAEDSPLLAVSGLQQRETWFRNNSGNYFEATAYSSKATQGRVLFAGESRKYPNFNPRFFAPHAYNTRPLLDLARASSSAAEMAKKARMARYRWILYNYPQPNFWVQDEAPFRWNRRSLGIYREFIAKWTVPRWSSRLYDERNGYFLLYEILPAPAKTARPAWFLPGTEGEFYALRMAASRDLEDPAVDSELARLEPVLDGIGMFEARKIAVYLSRARHSADSVPWCGKAASACWSARRADGFELAALVKSFPFPTSREIRGTSPAEISRIICAERMAPLDEHIAFALTEGFPLFHRQK